MSATARHEPKCRSDRGFRNAAHLPASGVEDRYVWLRRDPGLSLWPKRIRLRRQLGTPLRPAERARLCSRAANRAELYRRWGRGGRRARSSSGRSRRDPAGDPVAADFGGAQCAGRTDDVEGAAVRTYGATNSLGLGSVSLMTTATALSVARPSAHLAAGVADELDAVCRCSGISPCCLIRCCRWGTSTRRCRRCIARCRSR